jgi:hypothetical protein
VRDDGFPLRADHRRRERHRRRDMVEVNYLGVVGGVMAALPLMRLGRAIR